MQRWAPLVIATSLVAVMQSRALADEGPETITVPAGKIVVGIIPTVVVNLDTARADALGQDLAEALVAELDVEAKGGLEVRRAVPEVAADCVTTPACTTEVAQQLGANQLLFVVMVATGNQLQVDSTWVEPGSGRSAQRLPIDVANMNDAKTRFQAVAKQLLPDAPVRAKGGGVGPGTRTVMSGAVPMHFTTASKITAGVAGAGLVAGIVLGIVTRSKYGTCEDAPGTCSQGQEDSIRKFGLAADAGFAVAILSGIATTVLYATSGEKAHLVVAPAGSDSGAGITIGAVGRF